MTLGTSTLGTGTYNGQATSAPVFPILNIFPPPASLGSIETSDVSFEVQGLLGVDPSTIDVTINGVDAIINGVFQPGFTGPNSAITPAGSGFVVVVDRIAEYGSFEIVLVTAYAEDFSSTPASAAWSWRARDYLGPLVLPAGPTIGQSGVPPSQSIEIIVTDEDSITQVVANLEIRIDRGEGSGFEFAFRGTRTPQFFDEYSGPASSIVASPGQLTITIDPVVNFAGFATVTVEVLSKDVTGNTERI